MRRYFLLLFLFATSSFAYELIEPLSPQELTKRAEVVAVVHIVEGSVVNSKLDLVGEVDLLFKGKVSDQNIFFEHLEANFSLPPNTLGGTYLIFLERSDGKFITLQDQFSVIELGWIDSTRPDFDLIIQKLGLSPVSVVKESKNRFFYPEFCTEDANPACSKAVAILKYLVQ